MHPSPTNRPSVAQILLGLFVVWQLCFLATSNLIAFFPRGEPEEGELSDSRGMAGGEGNPGPLQNVIDAAGSVTDRWANLTGQHQVWWLFAPSFPRQATFPVVELRWDDPNKPSRSPDAGLPSQPVRLHSVFEPENPGFYLRLPGSFDRLFHYEMRLGLLMTAWTGHVKDDTEYAEWEDAVRTRVGRQWKSMRAYLLLRVRQFEQEHPELPPPTQAILAVRIYKTPSPDVDSGMRQPPIEKKLARWQPAADGGSEYLPVEMCDPRLDSFVRLRRVE